jgi:hypothetical protein
MRIKRLEVFRAKDENGTMKTRNRSAYAKATARQVRLVIRHSKAALLVAVLLIAALAFTPRAVAGSDDQAIIAGTKKYLASESYPAGMKVTVEKVEGDYARVAITPKDLKKMDGAIAFLKREHGQWKGLTIGTGWDPADLDKLHIPKSLLP